MNVNPNIDKPIFIQIAEQLEDSIFTGVFPEETQIPSTNEISALLSINPHTVLKEGAVEKIRQKRQSQFYEQYVSTLISEAMKLQMSKEDIISLIERGYDNERHSN